MRARHWWPLIGLTLLALAGCGSGGPSLPAATTITDARVQRTSGFPENNIPPFAENITDAAKAQSLYAAVLALPPFPSGTYHCPADLGVKYDVAFFAGDTETLDAAINASGCDDVTLTNPGSSARDIRWWAQSDKFWPTFADSLGVPESAIYPVIPNHSATPTP